MTEPLHLADKIVYTIILLYAMAIFAGLTLQAVLPYEQAKRAEWWTDSLASIPFAVCIYGVFFILAAAPFVGLYLVWFGADKR